jgi:hypothetical protein
MRRRTCQVILADHPCRKMPQVEEGVDDSVITGTQTIQERRKIRSDYRDLHATFLEDRRMVRLLSCVHDVEVTRGGVAWAPTRQRSSIRVESSAEWAIERKYLSMLLLPASLRPDPGTRSCSWRRAEPAGREQERLPGGGGGAQQCV